MAQNSQLTDTTTRHSVLLEGLKAGEVKKFIDFLRAMDISVSERLAGDELTTYARARLERLVKSTRNDLRDILGTYQTQLELSLINIAEYEAGFEARALANIGFESVTPSAKQVRSAIFTEPLKVRGADGGKLLDAFIEDWADGDADLISNQIRRGAYEGKTNAQIKREIRGTVARNYNDGSFKVVDRHAAAITRTSVQHVASVARQETWKENDDIIIGYRWISTLDSRTTVICRSLDGQVYKMNKGPLPPAHISCRSSTMAELDGRFSYLDEGGSRAARNLKTGKTVQNVPAGDNYYDWLKRQDREFIDEILGPERAKLLMDGGLSAARFSQLQLDKNFKPLTLAEMKEKEPLAFVRAGVKE